MEEYETLKNYAISRNIATNTARNYLNRYKELKGHYEKKNNTTYIDKYAINFIDEHITKKGTIVINETFREIEQQEKIQELEEEISKLKDIINQNKEELLKNLQKIEEQKRKIFEEKQEIKLLEINKNNEINLLEITKNTLEQEKENLKEEINFLNNRTLKERIFNKQKPK